MKRFIIFTVVFLIALWTSTRIPIFQHAYAQEEKRIKDDEWLLQQCNLPEFFIRMSQHSNICERLLQQLHIVKEPVWIVALRACLPQSISYVCPWNVTWQTWILFISGILFMVPSILWPWYCAREHTEEQLRILEACTPQIKSNSVLLGLRHRRKPFVW